MNRQLKPNNQYDNPPNNEIQKENFEKLVLYYLQSNPMIKSNNKSAEFEVRFNAKDKYTHYFTKIDYHNVIKRIYLLGFNTYCPNGGLHLLRIHTESSNNLRAELSGLDLIQEYCKSNSLKKILDLPSSLSTNKDKVKFTRKINALNPETNKPLYPVDFTNYGFRVSYQTEEDHGPFSNSVKEIMANWTDSKKKFRFLNRVRFSHPDYPIFVDVSIVKSSKKKNGETILTYTIAESGTLTNEETFEVELEIDNLRVGHGTEYNTSDKLLKVMRKLIHQILGALQETNYPISFSEKEQIQQSYLKLIHGSKYKFQRIRPRDLIGPSSYTLQMENIVGNIVDSDEFGKEKAHKPTGHHTMADNQTHTPTILQNMTVTDKADGERKMLFIHESGKIYMINTNTHVQFTGQVVDVKNTKLKLKNTLLDGEYISHNKSGELIYLYCAFDAYYIDGQSIRHLSLMPLLQKEASEEALQNHQCRFYILTKCVENIQNTIYPFENVNGKKTSPHQLKKTNEMPTNDQTICNFRIKHKTFEMTNEYTTIFQACNKILSRVKDGLLEYNTDGLIFTPAYYGVGSSKIGEAGPLYKITWEHSFKWKPPEYNTIDFLVTVKKGKDGQDEIHNLLEEGNTLKQYKTLILMCGFDKEKHSHINPYMEIINDRITKNQNDLDNNEKYVPIPFQPTNPFDTNAYICNIPLLNVSGNEGNVASLMMKTEEQEYFEEDMIVEFKYDTTKPVNWKWIPLRVRYDKTSELRAGLKNYGNSYHVANNNWSSIHNPITEEIITTGENIPNITSSIQDDDVYYNTTHTYNNVNPHTNTYTSLTQSMRDFHNLYVKSKLISSVSHREDTLIDYACGKGGDISKWIYSNLSFVYGIDYSKDNIHNTLNGACARYLNYAKKMKKIQPRCLFSHGNSGLNIRNEHAFTSQKDKEIAKAVFGKGAKDETLLGKGVYNSYGVAKDGFNISSVQFALHYFFENRQIFNQFCRNVSECTKLNGYFIGTCYDGETVFQLLKYISENDEKTIYKNEVPILKITKRYAETGFPNNETSLGYAIDVFQESINKTFREYLVNYKYLVRNMENYGFVECTQTESQQLGLPNSSGLFEELFNLMEGEVKKNPMSASNYKSAINMTNEEKQISFLNRFFVFKKVRNVDADKIAKNLSKGEFGEENNEELEQAPDYIHIPASYKSPKNKTRKLKIRKIVIDKYEPVEPNSLQEVVTKKNIVNTEIPQSTKPIEDENIVWKKKDISQTTVTLPPSQTKKVKLKIKK
jgi:hypothetical protein